MIYSLCGPIITVQLLLNINGRNQIIFPIFLQVGKFKNTTGKEGSIEKFEDKSKDIVESQSEEYEDEGYRTKAYD